MIIQPINAEISNKAISENLKRLINQTYKLLPNKEENLDWETPLCTIVEELSGMCKLLPNNHEILFSVLCKLKGLQDLNDDFFSYRRTIFECLNLLSILREEVEECH